MEQNKSSYGRSASMPLLQKQAEGEIENQLRWQLAWEDSQRSVENSPEYQRLRKSVKDSNGSCFYDLESPSCNTTFQFLKSTEMDTGEPTISPPASDVTVKASSSPEPNTTSVPNGHGSGADYQFASLGKLSAETPAFQSMTDPFTANRPNNSASTDQILRDADSAGSNGSRSNYSYSSNASSEGFQGGRFKAHGSYQSSRALQLDKIPQPPELHIQGMAMHRKQKSRLSSQASISSPLGSGHFTDDLGSDVSRPVFPSPVSASSYSSQHNTSRYLDPRSITIPNSNLGHSRQPTDPFIERSFQPGQMPAQFPRNMQRRTAIRSPNIQGLGTFQQDRHTGSRINLPIPPPPLPTVQGRLRSSPEARQRLNTQKTIREIWIRDEARKIADLNRVAFYAAQKYNDNKTGKNFEAWKHATQAFNDSINLEKRQEERRNLLMPRDMKALRTGPENLAADGSVSFSEPAESNSVREQGKLLGYQMAFMERICAEVAQRHEGGIHRHTMRSEGEKRALRIESVDCLQAASCRRMEREAECVIDEGRKIYDSV